MASALAVGALVWGGWEHWCGWVGWGEWRCGGIALLLHVTFLIVLLGEVRPLCPRPPKDQLFPLSLLLFVFPQSSLGCTVPPTPTGGCPRRSRSTKCSAMLWVTPDRAGQWELSCTTAARSTRAWITRRPRMRSSTRVRRMDLGTSGQNPHPPSGVCVCCFVVLLGAPVVTVHFLVTLGPQHVVLSYFTHSQTRPPPQFPNRNPLRAFLGCLWHLQ